MMEDHRIKVNLTVPDPKVPPGHIDKEWFMNPTLQVSVGIQINGGIILMPERVDDKNQPIRGGLYAPDPVDSSMSKLPTGYCIVPLGNGGKSCLETIERKKGDDGKWTGGYLQIATHDGQYSSWNGKVAAFLDPITLGKDNEVKITSWVNTALRVMYIASILMLILCIVVLIIAIIHLFVPG